MTERWCCAQAVPLLAEAAAGSATEVERARVARHVAECAWCRRELDQLREAADSLREAFTAFCVAHALVSSFFPRREPRRVRDD